MDKIEVFKGSIGIEFEVAVQDNNGEALLDLTTEYNNPAAQMKIKIGDTIYEKDAQIINGKLIFISDSEIFNTEGTYRFQGIITDDDNKLHKTEIFDVECIESL